MSFLAHSQRAYDSLPHSDLSHLSPLHTHSGRVPLHPVSSFDSLPLHPLSPTPSGCTLQNSHAQGNTATAPKPGQTRCCEPLSFSPDDRSSIVRVYTMRLYSPRPLTAPACRLESSHSRADVPLPGPRPRNASWGASGTSRRQVASHVRPSGRAGFGQTRSWERPRQPDPPWECHPVCLDVLTATCCQRADRGLTPPFFMQSSVLPFNACPQTARIRWPGRRVA